MLGELLSPIVDVLRTYAGQFFFGFIDIRPPGSDEITNFLVLGLIKMIRVRNSALTDEGLVDPEKLKVVS